MPPGVHRTYVAAMRIVAEEQAIEAVAVSRKAESDRQAQAQAALEHSRLRQERAMRGARLKVTASRSCRFTVQTLNICELHYLQV